MSRPFPFAKALAGASLLLALAACQDRGVEPSAPSAGEEAPQVAAEPAQGLLTEGSAGAAATATVKPARVVRTPQALADVDGIPFEGKRIALVHTANVIGELEPCG